jgi:hypothetical protein
VLQEPCIRGPSTSRETPPLSSPHGARNRALNNETLQNLDEVTSNLIICFEAERPPYLQHPAVLGETGLPEEEVAGPLQSSQDRVTGAGAATGRSVADAGRGLTYAEPDCASWIETKPPSRGR